MPNLEQDTEQDTEQYKYPEAPLGSESATKWINNKMKW